MTILSSTEARPQLEALVSGLSFVSESDAPLTVVSLGYRAELDASAVLAALSKPPDAPIEQVSVDDFFGYAVQDQTYYTEEQRSAVQRYRALVQFLRTSLSDARVFRIGKIEIDVYAVGKSRDGEWLGAATKLVET